MITIIIKPGYAVKSPITGLLPKDATVLQESMRASDILSEH